MKWCFDKESEFLQEYQKEINQVKDDNIKMSRIWTKKNKVLGKNVFITDFDNRNKK